MDFENFNCRICNGKLVPKLNQLVCSNCNFIQHPLQDIRLLKITPEDLKKKIDNKEEFLILDVRDKWEYSTANIKNSKFIQIRELKKNIQNLDKNKLVITVCHHGLDRSQNAARYLLQNNFKNVKFLECGIEAWSIKIDNSLKRY